MPSLSSIPPSAVWHVQTRDPDLGTEEPGRVLAWRDQALAALRTSVAEILDDLELPRSSGATTYTETSIVWSLDSHPGIRVTAIRLPVES